MAAFYRNPMFADATIAASDGMGRMVHKVVLAAASPQLKHMLCQSSALDMRAFSARALDTVLEFAYKGWCNMASKDAYEVMHLALALEMPVLVNRAEVLLKRTDRWRAPPPGCPAHQAFLACQAFRAQQVVHMQRALQAPQELMRYCKKCRAVHPMSSFEGDSNVCGRAP